MHIYAKRIMDDGNLLDASDHRSVNTALRTVKMSPFPLGSVTELLPKEAVCCSQATD